MKFVILFDMFLNSDYKTMTCFTDVARTTASKSKFLYQGSFQIVKNWVFV